MTTPTSYNPGGPLGDIPATPEPQPFVYKAAKAKAWLTSKETEALEKNAAVAPPVTITTIDGVPTVIARPALSGEAGVGQLMTDEDLRALGEEPLRFPVCEFPGCKGEGRHQIVSGAGKPLSINHKGQLVFGDAPSVDAHEMSANDGARARAGLAGVVGPSGQMGQQVPKFHVDVCQIHQTLPNAPRKPKQRYQSGPYTSYITARQRAAKVGLRTRVEPAVFPLKQKNGAELWFVRGDDGVRPPRGIQLTEL